MDTGMVLRSFGEAIPRPVIIAILFVPFLLCALAVWRWRGGSRFGAAILLVLTGVALPRDISGVIQGGNWAGIVSIISSVPSLFLLAILAVAQSLLKRRKKEGDVDSGAKVVEPEGTSESE